MHKYRYIYPDQQDTREVSNKAHGNFYASFLKLSACIEPFTANYLNWLNDIVLVIAKPYHYKWSKGLPSQYHEPQL